MKKLIKRVLPMIGMTMMLTSSAFANEAEFGSAAAQADSEFTLEEMLAYGLEDERMAQAEYEAIMDAFDVDAPFANIAKAEVSHEAAILNLYEVYGLEVPEFDAREYVVIPDTLEEIYAIGVTAEIANIAMYDKFLETDLDDQVRAVFTALRDASENHLAAFERGVSAGGATFSGQANGNGQSRGSRNDFTGSSESTVTGNINGQAKGQRGGNKGNGFSEKAQVKDFDNCIFF